MRLGHARGLACAKTKKFPCIFLASPPPHPSTAKRPRQWKGNFWFCFAVSVSEKSIISLTLLIALFSALTATEAHPYPRLVVALKSANHTQPPPHSPLAFARAGCFGVVCVRLVASREFSCNSNSIWIVLGTNKSVCACPARPVRAQQSRRF